jgi:hypothetical protein
MANKKYNNNAINLQLEIMQEINRILHAKKVVVTGLDVNIKTFTKDKKNKIGKDSKEVNLTGTVKYTFDSRLNADTQRFSFGNEDEDDGFISSDDEDFNQ